MDKITYLAELAEGLARWVPERERQDILRYYAEYFEEAGSEREAEVVAELGDPWALSCRLAVEGGYVSQEAAQNWTPRQNKRKVWPVVAGAAAIVLIVAVVAVASLASNVGRLVGHFVGYSEYNVAVEDDPMVGEEMVTFIDGESFSGSVQAFDVIDAEIGLGSISVVAGDDYTLHISQDVALGGYNLEWEVQDRVLKLRDSNAVSAVKVSNWDEFKELFGASREAVEVIITVPEGAMLDQISVETGVGNVMLYDMCAKKISAKTGMGSMECYNPMEVKQLDLETGMGGVTLGMDEPCSGVKIDLESGMGTVEASLGCAEWECAYEAETGMGNVTIDGSSRGSKAERRGGNLPYSLEAESGMGDVNIYFYE